ncbi:alpha-galactosidase [Paenibacillus glycinis]|uniref:Alpha-galactosidase n=1 Tax=Paenibacillus glycinis TaxID=2697035 RepID=A0ABW9XN12_9BACL|nr:alpha-galactosidase [Paenibacillus glycinis]NBD24016.1 hypothetical protein [Paenibacillus glycinis]
MKQPLWTAGNASVRLRFYGEEARFWSMALVSGTSGGGREWTIGAPAFEVNGALVPIVLDRIEPLAPPRKLGNGTTEYRLGGIVKGMAEAERAGMPELRFAWIVRIPDGTNPVVRFRYELSSPGDAHLTKTTGRDRLRYAFVSLTGCTEAAELRFSEFQEMTHSFSLSERPLDERHFDNGEAVMGPMLTAGDGREHLLLAYEHGSQLPEAFLRFRLDADRGATIEAVKANYLDGQSLQGDPYGTLWLQAACAAGGERELAAAYRDFVLHHFALHEASRKPYIFYNTWNYQERLRNWQGKSYLAEMNLARMLLEIDAAHEMGIDVFVLDTGWYGKTGDWQVNLERFPDGLRQVKARLDAYGMKLGLWFNPTAAAVSSRMLREHPDCIASWNGVKGDPQPIWETEASHMLCLVSRYADAFAEELIRLVREVGVTYFKWDGIGQHGCDDPGHDHGTIGHSPQERADSYAFRQVQAMARIADTLSEACPEAIVDFDITEGHRSVGLAFLAVGKYFLVNNGPYFHNYDVPIDMASDNWNLFFYPGAARGRICRAPLGYDKWIPSVLFLTHYLPDDPAGNQLMSLGSLMLGQNGVWGDLPAVSEAGRRLFGSVLARYKEIRDDITASDPAREGIVGGDPEIHEKIHAPTGRGAVVLFASEPGIYRYVTRGRPDFGSLWHTDGAAVTRDAKGRAVIEAQFRATGAHIVLFGASQ